MRKSLSRMSFKLKTLRLSKERVSLNIKIKWDSMRSLKIKTTKTVMKSSNLTMMAMTMNLNVKSSS